MTPGTKILVTCPPMLRMIEEFQPIFHRHRLEVTAHEVIQTLPVDVLMEIVPQHDGWIIGDDPATAEVFAAGKRGRLRAAVKWGIGVDNVDFSACKELGIPITNTPNMFGGEVADIAVGYVIALARETFEIDRGVRAGEWPKPTGISLAGKTAALVGYGDIGKNTARRLLAAGMNIIAYDPIATDVPDLSAVQRALWPTRIQEADFIVLTCSLTDSSYHMLNKDVLSEAKFGVRVVNVGRGPVIEEVALIESLRSGKVRSAALDVFETEPLSQDSYLRSHPHCILGSHNASNTVDAVVRTSEIAIDRLLGFLEIETQ
jgi:D-3-phosphoglycerate dehydrogenase / 2-oxoglutarate reductase